MHTVIEGHEGHSISCAVAGAPGVGRVITCHTCDLVLEDTIRVLQPWEVE